jgi:hypothetical protein
LAGKLSVAGADSAIKMLRSVMIKGSAAARDRH